MRVRRLAALVAVAVVLAGCTRGALPSRTPAPSQPTAVPTAASKATGQSAGSGNTALTGEIPIGAVWSITGGASVYGATQKNAADLAVDEINASGMLGSAKVKLVTEDDRSTKEGAIAAFEKLLNQDKVVAILGPTLSNSAKAADPMAQQRKVVVLGVSNTADGITEMGDYVFRDSLPESAVVPNTVKVTREKFGYKKVAVIYGDDDAFTKSGYDVFKKALQENGVTIVDTETFKKGDTDFSAQLTKIKAQHPDAIIVSALAQEAARIMSQGRQLGIPDSVRFIGGNGFNSPNLAKLAGKAAEGAVSGAAWYIGSDEPANQTFVRAYRARYHADPDQFAAQACTGVYLLADAIKQVGKSDPTAIRDSLVQLRNVATPLGSFSFTANREPVHTPVVQVVCNGKFELFK